MPPQVKKASIFVGNLGEDICSPFFDEAGALHIIRQQSSEILSVDSVGNTTIICSTDGQPNSASYSKDGVLYITDFAHSAVLAVQKDSQQELVVGVYEDKPLKGPNTIYLSNENIYFTDSGSFGDTGLHSQTGSLFTISNTPSGQILKPISLCNLAYPTGLVVSKDENFIYVAEMMQNRILRYFQRPTGVYHGSVFFQLNGGVGPSCLALDANGNLLIGQYDLRENSSEGHIYIVSRAGKLVSTIITNGPELSGLTISEGILYVTEKSTGSIQTFEL